MSDEEDYVEEMRVVRRRKDTFRSNSTKSDEFESDLLRSRTTRGVAGPTESRAVNEDELRQRYQVDPTYVASDLSQRKLTPGQQARADAIVEISAVVIRELVAPLIRDILAPAAKARLTEFTEHRRTRALDRAESKAKGRDDKVQKLETVPEADPSPAPPDLEVMKPSIPMTHGELVLAHLRLKVAEEYAAEQRWLIIHAEVADGNLSSALDLPLTRILEGHADKLSKEDREAVATFVHHASLTTHPVMEHQAEQVNIKLALYDPACDVDRPD